MIYLFVHPDTGETKEVSQSINQEHVYVDDAGVKWNREFSTSQISVDAKINPFDSKKFVEKTGKQTGTLGDLMDQSKEMSAKREQIAGRDPVKAEYYKKYSERRRGKVHPDAIKDGYA